MQSKTGSLFGFKLGVGSEPTTEIACDRSPGIASDSEFEQPLDYVEEPVIDEHGVDVSATDNFSVEEPDHGAEGPVIDEQSLDEDERQARECLKQGNRSGSTLHVDLSPGELCLLT